MKRTILVTGGTGYIGSWVTKELLEKGHAVKLAVRDKSKKEKYAHLLKFEAETEGTLEVFNADLLSEGSYDEAAKGCTDIIHMASPFILAVNDAQKDLIDPALKGTQNVLNAANKSGTVTKVVLTSSVAAVYGDNADMADLGIKEFTEQHFNTTSTVAHQPYSYSKVLAEKEAWKINKAQNKWKLVVVNPSLVMGPSLTTLSNSESLSIMKDLLIGKMYMGVPHLVFGLVDVRDTAHAHVMCMESETAEGRHVLAERTISMFKYSRLIKHIYGSKYKLPISQSPKIMIYLTGWMFDLKFKFIKRNVGHSIMLNTTKSRDVLGLKYRDLENTIKDMVTQMHATKVLR